MTRFKAPIGAALEAVREEFVALDAARELMSDGGSEAEAMEAGETTTTLPISQLYAYAIGRITYPNAAIEAALAGAPGLRAAFRRMVMAAPAYRFERAAAAADSGPPSRRTAGAMIRFSQSRAHEDRMFIIIELDVAEDAPRTMTVFDAEDHSARLDLPRTQNGIIQLLVRKDSAILKALENPDTNIALM